MPLHHVWGWHPPHTISHIRIGHLQSVLVIIILSQTQRHVDAPFYHHTSQVGSRFENLGSLVKWKWCHYNIMSEADIHIRPLQTSTLDIFKVFEPLVCCIKLNGMWLHPYTITPAKLATDLGVQGPFWNENDVITSWYPPQTTSYIHIRHIQSVWASIMLSQGHIGAPLYRYTGQVGPRFGSSGSLVKWKWCHSNMDKADIHLRPLPTSI